MLRVFETNTHRYSFCLKRDIGGMQTAEHVVGRMASGKHHTVSPDFSGIGTHSFGNPIFYDKTAGRGHEPHLSPAFQNLIADIPDDMRKQVAAYVWMGVHENIGTGTMLYKQGQHLVDIAPLPAPCIKLAVAVSSRSPLSETIVALWIDPLAAGYFGEINTPGVHIPAPFQHYRPYTMAYSLEGTEKSRRTGSDHKQYRGAICNTGKLYRRETRANFPIVTNSTPQNYIYLYIAFAGINRPAHHPDIIDRRHADTKCTRRTTLQFPDICRRGGCHPHIHILNHTAKLIQISACSKNKRNKPNFCLSLTVIPTDA